MSSPAAEPEFRPAQTRSRHLLPAVVGAVLAATVLTAGTVAWFIGADAPQRAQAAAAEPVPDPTLAATPATGATGAAPWEAPLTLVLVEGTFKDVAVLDPDGNAFSGGLADPTTWRSTADALIPAATYQVTAAVRDTVGRTRPMTLAVRTTPAARVLHATLTPGDDDVVGVGMPGIVYLDQPVVTAADRALVEQRLTVTTVPAVAGAWRWMSATELHYRGPSYWKPGTTITIGADLHRLRLSDGTWGSGVRTSSYRVGDAVISTVDVTGHSMTVRRNGTALRTMKVSTGRDAFPTRGGAHLVLEKVRVQVMDSATVGIPRTSPNGYFEQVPFSVRISYSGEFVHSAGWSVQDQGVRNVSHGCVNVSPADAEWFFQLARRGDVVNVINAASPPLRDDPGTSDWNIPFASWAN
ncbi:MAG: ErfK/YbiS/YcfS/YnhG family protein [Frankiales bacterium]|nr:ErfK/YbiS/YcfS/YnhG family protein [Frankiales bacterium]